MRRVLPLLLLAVAACASPPEQAAVFECPGLGDVVIRHRADDAVVEMAGRRFTLPREIAASGVRYQKDDVQFWEHQGEAMIDLEGRHYMGCKHNPARTPR